MKTNRAGSGAGSRTKERMPMKSSGKNNRWFAHRLVRKSTTLRKSVDATFETMEKRTLMTALAVWNFNDGAVTPSTTSIANMMAVDRTAPGVTASMSNNFTNGVTNLSGSTLNADSGDSPGVALDLQPSTSNVNNGKALTFSANTNNYSNISVSFATVATGS